MKAMITILSAALFGCAAGASVTDEACSPMNCLPCQKNTCCPEAEIKKQTKHCWDVQCKEICIPAIRLPWSKRGQRRCGRVRMVKVLKKVEYEVETITDHWRIVFSRRQCP